MLNTWLWYSFGHRAAGKSSEGASEWLIHSSSGYQCVLLCPTEVTLKSQTRALHKEQQPNPHKPFVLINKEYLWLRF